MAAALLSAALLAACGGGDSTIAVVVPPTAAAVMRCVRTGGGHQGDQVPVQPNGFPVDVETAMIAGPDYNHIGFYISRKRVFTPRVAQGFDEIGEFQATILLEGHALMLAQPRSLSKQTKRLALSCLEG